MVHSQNRWGLSLLVLFPVPPQAGIHMGDLLPDSG